MNNICVLVPAFNVSQYLPEVILRIPKNIWKQIKFTYIIDDASTDDTARAVANLKIRFPKIRLIRKSKHQGYAKAQKTGITHALADGAEAVVILHGDGQYAPEEIIRMIEPIEQGRVDLVIGSRIMGGGAIAAGMPLVRYLGNRILTAIENMVFRLNFTEYHSGYMAYSRRALKKIPFEKMRDSFHFDGEMLMVGAKMGLRVCEVPISTHYEGQISNLRPIRYLMDIGAILWKYKRGGYG